ncbi:enterochelin esterase [Flexilinea flocculi]|uniref:Enterochelin esterase n=2 Tax=Flexilinea flocculi TaxID=1678840 RepID=A0A0S7BRE2_9CHLR|nr:enterochelin esterase [Flexilinea flocculi]
MKFFPVLKAMIRNINHNIQLKFLLFLILFGCLFESVIGFYDEKKGNIVSYSSPMKFQIYFPPDYQKNAEYPVLFLLHGQSQNESIWQQNGLLEAIDRLIQEKRIQPLVVVMPREERYMELLQESNYDQMIIDQLLPFVRETFQIGNKRESTGIGGISRGALWAQKIAFHNYSIFGVIGLHSLPDRVFSDSTVFRIFEDNKGLFPEAKIRIDIGTEDGYLDGARAFVQQLSKLGYPYDFILNSGKHDIDYWKSQVENYLIWYSDNLQK